MSPEVEKYMAQGKQYAQRQQFSQAIQAFQKCIELDKTYAPPYFNIALLLVWQEDYTNADRYLQDFLKLRTNDAQAYTLAATVAMELGRNQDIISNIEKAIAIEPNNPAILYNAAEIFLRMGDFPRSQEYARRGIALLSSDEQASDLAMRLWTVVMFASLEVDDWKNGKEGCATLLNLPLEDKHREMVEDYQKDFVFIEKNQSQPVFITAYKVSVALVRGKARFYTSNYAQPVVIFSLGSGGKISRFTLLGEDFSRMGELLLFGYTVQTVERTKESAARSEVERIFSTMVGEKTLVAIFTKQGKIAYALFEPFGNRVLLKALYVPDGAMFMM